MVLLLAVGCSSIAHVVSRAHELVPNVCVCACVCVRARVCLAPAVLFGDVNPAARLPLTFPNVENEVGFTERQYPGLNNAEEAYYDEKLLVGYR